jgi:hypothetical protein
LFVEIVDKVKQCFTVCQKMILSSEIKNWLLNGKKLTGDGKKGHLSMKNDGVKSGRNETKILVSVKAKQV